MIQKISGNGYEFVVASDVTRDGLGVEAWREEPQAQLCEIFRFDTDGSFVFTAFEQDIPLEVIEQLCTFARERLVKQEEAAE